MGPADDGAYDDGPDHTLTERAKSGVRRSEGRIVERPEYLRCGVAKAGQLVGNSLGRLARNGATHLLDAQSVDSSEDGSAHRGHRRLGAARVPGT